MSNQTASPIHFLKTQNRALVDLDEAKSDLTRLAIHEIDAAEPSERAKLVDQVVDAMPSRRREVFLLVRELGYTYKEVAELLGLSEGTINTHMRLATDDVRAALQRLGTALPPGSVPRLPGPHNKEGSDV